MAALVALLFHFFVAGVGGGITSVMHPAGVGGGITSVAPSAQGVGGGITS